ncbi:MAG: hypothetical protein JRI48_02310 [Deltaproteobacteria bacterium]|nr:hypothetical protein [Deltaproteobacteria bacterium]
MGTRTSRSTGKVDTRALEINIRRFPRQHGGQKVAIRPFAGLADGPSLCVSSGHSDGTSGA